MADSFDKEIDKFLQEERMFALARASAFLMEGILEATPDENPGRMKAPWIGGIRMVVEDFQRNGINARSLDSVGASHLSSAPDRSDGSWDSQYFDDSGVFGTLSSSTAVFQNALPFADEMEFGGSLSPISPGGPKVEKVFPGAFLSARTSGTSGMLRWVDESGKERVARNRSLPGTNSMEKGFANVKRNGKKLGLEFV